MPPKLAGFSGWLPVPSRGCYPFSPSFRCSTILASHPLSRPESTLSPRLAIALAALLFSTGGIAIKAIPLDALQIASFRSGIAALTLLLLVPAARRHFGWRPLLVGLVYALTVVTYVLANRLTTSANAIYLSAAAPVYLLLLGPWLLREPLRRSDGPVIGAVLLGLLLVFLGEDPPSATAPDPARGNLLGAISGMAYACTIAGLRWIGRRDTDPAATVAAVILGNLLACIVVLPFILPLGPVPLPALLGVGYLGVFQIGLAYLLMTRGLRQVTALEASLLLMIETACNPVWVWLLLGETPSLPALFGGAIIIVGTALHGMRARSTTPPVQPA